MNKSQHEAGIIGLIKNTVRQTEPDAQVILYGSRARGTARKDSDWDVIVIVDKPHLSLDERSSLGYDVWEKGLEYGADINVLAYTRRQWEKAPPTLFKHNVREEGIRL